VDDHSFAALAKDLRRILKDLNTGEQMEVLELAWMRTAESARQAALAFPDGFQNELERQVTRLEILAEEVREDTPDLEGQRLLLENDPAYFGHQARRYADRCEVLRQREEAARQWDEQHAGDEWDEQHAGDDE
jgi:hypothetical protein